MGGRLWISRRWWSTAIGRCARCSVVRRPRRIVVATGFNDVWSFFRPTSLHSSMPVRRVVCSVCGLVRVGI